MGKTQSMLQYCYLHLSTYRYVFWMEMDGVTAAQDSFRRLAQNLGLNVDNSKEDDSEKTIDRVLLWLEQSPGWLILLDNADEDVFRYIPRVGGDVILTTRVPVSTDKATVIHVDKMHSKDALLILLGLKELPLENSSEWEGPRFDYAQKIVVELDYMALAVDLARAYIHRTRTPLKDYLAMFNKERDAILTYHDKSILDRYKHTIATVWQLSFERLRQQDPVAAQILDICAFLQPDVIPAIFFENQSAVLLPSEASQMVSEHSEPVVRAAIAVLTEFSFLKLTRTEYENDDGDPSKDMLAIHRLVQTVVYDLMDNDRRLYCFQQLATAFQNEIGDPDYFDLQDRNTMDIYLPHIRHFTAQLVAFNGLIFTDDLDGLLRKVVQYLIKGTILNGTEELAKFSISVTESVNGKEHYLTASCLCNLADLYRKKGRYNEAEPLYKRALSIKEKVFGSEHLETATTLNNLGFLYDDQGRYNEAEPLYKRALSIQEKSLGSEHPSTAISLSNLAGLYDSQGRYDEAEPLYKQVLLMGEKSLGSEHPSTAISLSNLATLYDSQGRYDEAEPLYKRALSTQEKLLGSEHPSTAVSLSNLAGLYDSQGRYDEAEPLYKRVLSIQEKSLGSEHPSTAISLSNLAVFYDSKGRYDEAEPLYKRALSIEEKALGLENPNMAITLGNLACLYDHQGRRDEAGSLYEQALSILEEAWGPEHPGTRIVRNNLAKFHKNENKDLADFHEENKDPADFHKEKSGGKWINRIRAFTKNVRNRSRARARSPGLEDAK